MSSTVTFLNAVNSVLKRVGVIQGSTGDLTALSSTNHQREVDIVIQVWNEVLAQLYSLGSFTGEVASATIVGVSGQREYAFPTDFVNMAGTKWNTRVVRGATKQWVLYEYEGGYQQMYADQPMATQFGGAPVRWVINPVTNQLRFDTQNDSANAATSTYNFLYEKAVRFTTTTTATSDIFPFPDTIVDSLIPVVSQFHDSIMKGKFDNLQFKQSMSRAASQIGQTQPMLRWGTRHAR